jgi:hypothetical protein
MSNDKDELFELNYDECLARTEEAVLLLIDDDDLWVPRSVLWVEEHPEPGCGPGAVNIEEWWAVQRGLA